MASASVDDRHLAVIHRVPRPRPQGHVPEQTRSNLPLAAGDERDEDRVVMSSPAFLKALQPPPLPIWAVPHTTKALTTTRVSLLAARRAAAFGFDVSRTATSFGFAVARAVVKGIGSVADAVTGSDATPGGGQLGQTPIAKALSWPVDGVEQLALFGINLGNGITNAVFQGVTSSVQWLESVYGNDEAVRALEAFLVLVQREWNTSLPTDPYSEGGLSRWNIVQVGKAAATWAALQTVTRRWEGSRIAPELEELDIASWGRGASNQEQHNMVWEVTDEEILATGEQVIEAQTTTDDSFATSIDNASEEQRMRAQLRRFSKMCLGSYGGMGTLFFGVKLPVVPDSPSTLSGYGTPLSPSDLSRIPSSAFVDASGSMADAQSVIDQTEVIESRLGDLQTDFEDLARDDASDTATSNDLAHELGLQSRKKNEDGSLWQKLTGAQ